MGNEIELNAKGIDLAYVNKGERKEIFSKFSYSFVGGKIYLLKGKSGVGKTSLLSILGLLQNADSGVITLNGMRVDNLSNEQKCSVRRQKIGIAFQEPFFIQGLSIRDNIELVSLIEKKTQKYKVENKCSEIGKMLQIDDRLDAFPKELSGGEKQRANLARAVMNMPDVLLCDEPIANVDEENANIIIKFLRGYSKERGKLVILVSHSSHFDDIADCIIHIGK